MTGEKFYTLPNLDNVYRIHSKISETQNSIIFEAEDAGGRFVTCKVLKLENPTPTEIGRLKREYELIQKIECSGVLTSYDIGELKGRPAIVLEHFQGETLKAVIPGKLGDYQWFLRIAKSLAGILGELHQHKIVHRDIKPDNILINADQVKITDFGISAEITKERREIYSPDLIEGTLPYMSPEQTGRINRSVDYRTDLYSLGITFFEMLTGRRPFESDDPVEIIHYHIAKQPTPLSSINAQIPLAISDIVMKLLAKMAEDRYQNSFGLLADLQRCDELIVQKGTQAQFTLGTKDISLQYNPPQQLLARDEELGTLMRSFRKAGQGHSQVVLLHGDAGLGKSDLIEELRKSIIETRSCFISGRYGHHKQNVPYNSIIQAFKELVRQIITQSEERIAAWKKKIQDAVGESGSIITGIIPDMELLLGPQPALPDLETEAAQNRFIMVFKEFIRAVATREHPLTLFLDDFHVADAASIPLLTALLRDKDIQYLMLIFGYRWKMVEARPNLKAFLENIDQSGFGINRIVLKPFDVETTNLFINNFMKCDPAQTKSLAELIHKKTGGNPFFINQFMKRLYDDTGLLRQDPETGWHWDQEQIAQMQVTENVVVLLAEKIQKYPEDTRQILKVCACIGTWFELEMVAAVMDQPVETVLSGISQAMDEGLITLRENLYWFHHDRIQEAAYSLIPEEERQQLHYRIGYYLLETTSEAELPEKLLYLVNQLNAAKELVTTPEERHRFAAINARAARKAKDSAAFDSAYRYLQTALSFIDDSFWDKDHALCLDIYNALVETSFITHRHQEMEDYAAVLLQYSRQPTELLTLYETRIQAYIAQDKKAEAIQAVLEIFHKLNFRFPDDPSRLDVARMLIRLNIALIGKKPRDLKNMPMMTDPYAIAIMKMTMAYSSVGYWAKPESLALLSFNSVRLTVKKGLADSSPYHYAGYGLILCSLGRYKKGYQFGKLGLELLDKLQIKEQEARTRFLFLTWIKHWQEPVTDITQELQEVYDKAMEVGNLEFAGYALMVQTFTILLIGSDLSAAEEVIARNVEILEDIRQESQLHIARISYQNLHNLLGRSANPTRLIGDIYDEETMLPVHEAAEDHFVVHFLYVSKLTLQLVFNEYESAVETADLAYTCLDEATKATTGYVALNYYDSLSHLALCNEVSFSRRQAFLRRVRINQRQMRRWAKIMPANFLYRYLIVRAEYLRVLGKYEKALRFYNRALEELKKDSYLQELGVYHELVARFWSERGNTEYMEYHLKKAFACFTRWGAVAKVRQMENKYRDLLVTVTENDQFPKGTITFSSTTTSGTDEVGIDLTSVIKASHAISGEIELDNLLQNMMRIAIENAGAQRGVLLLEQDGRYYVEAESDVDGTIQVLKGIAYEEYEYLPRGIISYVDKTGDNVVLNNAVEDEQFFSDPYIVAHNVKSILCAPVMHKGKKSGIVFLENNLTTNAFTPQRLEMLRFLSAQSAISIENARLFELARRDGLTRLINHRYFKYSLHNELVRSEQEGRDLSLLILDIDFFKSFNDNYGHQLGDRVLEGVARILTDNAPNKDFVSRYGGEEFAVIYPGAGREEARKLAESIRLGVENWSLEHDEEMLRVTISIGVATYPHDAGDSQTLIRNADRALYFSKENGRNRVTAYDVSRD